MITFHTSLYERDRRLIFIFQSTMKVQRFFFFHNKSIQSKQKKRESNLMSPLSGSTCSFLISNMRLHYQEKKKKQKTERATYSRRQ